ncbi:MAG TPA: RNA-binding domain-containing protein [Trueperaceae bacterium]
MKRIDGLMGPILAGARADDVESEVLDFKAERDNLKSTLDLIADAVVCFANAHGGTIVVGVSDKIAGPAAISGVSANLTVRSVVSGVFERTRPGLSVPVQEHIVIGRRVLEITVPVGATLYANARGTVTRRIGTSCQPFPPEQQRQALAARGLHDWSAEPAGTARFAESEIVRIKRLLRAAGRDELADRDSTVILRDLRLLRDNGELTRAGLLLVGEEEDLQNLIPSHGYAYQYRPHPGVEATARFRAVRPLLAGVEHLIDVIDARRSIRPLNLAGGVQVQLQDYPTEAVRELVVNAFVHRDYETSGTIEVEQSQEQLRISSPGGLVFGVTTGNLLSHPSTPRNHLLLETVTALQVAERAGQGIDRAYRYLLRGGKKPPSFADSGEMFESRIHGGIGNDSFARFVNSGLPDGLEADIEVLMVLDALCSVRAVDATSMAPLFQRSPAEAQVTLERMQQAGLVEPTKRSASRAFPRYGLTASALTGLGLAVAYHRRMAEGSDDKVVQHVLEYGHISNQTLRRLFDLDVFTARDMLRDLQARGLVVKVGTRGPGVKYIPGPNFPGEK